MVGNVDISDKYKINSSKSYFHESSFYGRFGKPEWKVKLYGGLNHQVFWGNNKNIFPTNEFTLSPEQEYWYVVAGIPFNHPKVGNHLRSVDLGLDFAFSTIQLS
jgi:hypothetical protein